MADNLTFHGQVLLTEASSSFSGLYLDDSSLEGIPPGFNYADITELQDFSHLRMRWWYVEGGLKHLFQQRYALEYNLTYNDYDDYQPYIVDTTGKRFGMNVRMNVLF